MLRGPNFVNQSVDIENRRTGMTGWQVDFVRTVFVCFPCALEDPLFCQSIRVPLAEGLNSTTVTYYARTQNGSSGTVRTGRNNCPFTLPIPPRQPPHEHPAQHNCQFSHCPACHTRKDITILPLLLSAGRRRVPGRATSCFCASCVQGHQIYRTRNFSL